MNISDLILNRVSSLGVTKLFGIPGDYVLPFFDNLVKEQSPVQHIGTTNELTAVYAADGYSRIKGFGVAAVTYGPGALNGVNAVAGAYNENVPLLFIAGAPNTTADTKKHLLHHVLGNHLNKTVDLFKAITADSVRLTSADTAAVEIDALIKKSLDTCLPVYLEIPYDLQLAELSDIPEFHYTPPVSNQANLKEVLQKIEKEITLGKNTSLLTGKLINRHRVEFETHRFLQDTHIPFATTFDSKTSFAETLSNCVGFYQGAMSTPLVKSTIEDVDTILLLGCYLTEFNTGMYTDNLDSKKIIQVLNDQVTLKGKMYTEVYFKDVVQGLFEMKSRISQAPVTFEDTFIFTKSKPLNISRGKKITIDNMYQQLAYFFEDGDCLLYTSPSPRD